MYSYHIDNGGEYDEFSSITLYSEFKLSEVEFMNMVKDAVQIVGNDIFKVVLFLKNEYEYFENVESVAFATVYE